MKDKLLPCKQCGLEFENPYQSLGMRYMAKKEKYRYVCPRCGYGSFKWHPTQKSAIDSWNARILQFLFTTHPTVEEYEEKTGKKLGDEDAVWVYMEGWEEADKNAWELVKYGIIGWENPIVVVAIPGLSKPDDDWRPE